MIELDRNTLQFGQMSTRILSPTSGTRRCAVSRIRLKYIHQFIHRHGKARHYLGSPGFKRVPLPGLPASPGRPTLPKTGK